MAARHSRVPTFLALLVTLPVVVLGTGFVFHTDFEPAVLGKYGGGYFAFLLVWWILVTPLTFLFARFVLRTQRLELPSGRALHLRPLPKLVLCLLLYWGLSAGVRYQIHRQSGRGVSTAMRSDEFHPYLQNTLRPGRVAFGTNRWGFRGREIEREKPAGTLRVFAVGGSTTACVPMPLGETWPEVLAAKLREAHPGVPIEMQNAACDWHTSQHSLVKLLTDLRAFAPDVVLCLHGINDLVRSLTPDLFGRGPYRDDYRHYFGAISSLAQPEKSRWPIVRMRLGYWFSDFRMHRVRVLGPHGEGLNGARVMFFPKTDPVEVEAWPSVGAFQRNLTDLCAVCAESKIDLVLASQPHMYRPDLDAYERSVLWMPVSNQWGGQRASIASMRRGMAQVNAATAAVAQAWPASFVDVEATVPKTLENFHDDVHYTPRGCAAVAEAFFTHIQAQQLVGRQARGGAAVPGADSPAAAEVKGRVVEADVEGNRYVLDVGTDAGVRVGAKLIVSRGSEYVATLEVQAVEAGSSVGAAVEGLSKSPIEAGDVVFSE